GTAARSDRHQNAGGWRRLRLTRHRRQLRPRGTPAEASPAALRGRVDSMEVSIIRRPVKFARLRVRENLDVELIVPDTFTPAQTQALLRNKAAWIERQRTFFRARPKQKPNLADDE